MLVVHIPSPLKTGHADFPAFQLSTGLVNKSFLRMSLAKSELAKFALTGASFGDSPEGSLTSRRRCTSQPDVLGCPLI